MAWRLQLAGWLGCGILTFQGVTSGLAQTAQETLVLVGTMGYDKEQLAFFDGSNPGFRQALNVGDNIGGWDVKAIDFKQVTLKAGPREMQLAVGTYLRRAEAGDWQFAGNAASTFTPPEVVSRNTAISPSRPAAAQNFSQKSKSADQKDVERWAEKKVTKHLAELDSRARKEMKTSKGMERSFQEALKKVDKLDKRQKHGQG